VLILVAAAAGWWWTHRSPPPRTPPEGAIADPVVAAAVSKARAEVIAHPNDSAAWGRLGQTFLANGELIPARECLAEAGRLDPGNPVWPYLEGISLLLSDPVAAIPCWQRAAECPGDDDRAVTARLRWAEALLANNQPSEAESALQQVRAGHPTMPRLTFDLGLLAMTRGDTQAAIDLFRKCLDDPAARRKSSTHLAALYASLGKSAGATEFARKAEELPPDHDWPDPFLESYVGFTIGRESLFIQAEKEQQRGNIRQAILLYREVIQQYPAEGRAYAKLGMLLAELGDYAEAERVLRNGLAVEPNMVQNHFFLAVALFHQAERVGLSTPAGQEKLKQTEAEARKATQLKPDHGFAYLYLGLSLNNLGQKKEALAAFREAVRCTPEATDPHLHLGQALAEEGQTDEAITELEAATRLATPTDTRPRTALDRVRKAKKPD
jgi:tetratricopeptide (TPR) repeat protein